jgi:hypothetical protein
MVWSIWGGNVSALHALVLDLEVQYTNSAEDS